MSYTTTEDLIAWVAGDGSRLELLLRVEGAAVEAQVSKAIQVASAKMDGFFGRAGYAVPLALGSLPETKALVGQRCIALAVRELFIGLDGIPATFTEEANRADQWLNQLSGVQGFDGYGHLGRLFTNSNLPGVPRVA